MKLKKEFPLLIIVTLPFIYLASIWNQLPEKVPVHWNFKGEVDRFGGKTELLVICFTLPVLTYFIFLALPKIDPKNKLQKMGKKLDTIKFIMTALMSVLALIIIYATKNQSFNSINYITLLLGILYFILGNYFKTLKPNYFIGIKTPWTLESEFVWKKTHQLAGKLWFVGGILVIISCLLLNQNLSYTLFLIITAIISIIPFIHSFLLFRKEKKAEKLT